MPDPYDFLSPGEQERIGAEMSKMVRAALVMKASGDPAMGAVGDALLGELGQRRKTALAGQAARTKAAAEADRRAWQEGRDTRAQAAAMERAKLMAGGQAAARAETRRAQGEAREEGRKIREEDKLERAAEKVGKDLEPVAGMVRDLGTLEAYANESDQPGFGVLAGHLPGFMTSDQGVALRQAAGRLMIALLYATSGKAVSEQEAVRQLRARGLGPTSTPAEFKAGVGNLGAEVRDLYQRTKAKHRPEAVKLYEDRGGFVWPDEGDEVDDLLKMYGGDE
jgi:hypothetical protein